MTTSKVIKIFWSWQSDAPTGVNRNLIEAAIKAAAKTISKTESFVIEVDRDTKGIGGTPNISETILEKISACDLFIWDATLIGGHSSGVTATRLTTNPNVMFELGFAVAALGWERVIGVMNTHFGAPAELPFDVRHRRWPINYALAEDATSDDKKAVREELSKTLAYAILSALSEPRRGLMQADEDLGTVTRLWSQINSPWLLDWYETSRNYEQYGEDRYFGELEQYRRVAMQPENAFVDPELGRRHGEFLQAINAYLGGTAVEMVPHDSIKGKFVLSVKYYARYDDDYDSRYQAQVDRVQATVEAVWEVWRQYVLRVRERFPNVLS